MSSKTGKVLALILTQGFLLAYIMTLPKGFWADEVLQFAPAAFPNVHEAAAAIFGSIRGGLNHGQTGGHMLLNYFSLKALGASYFALRWPSYLAYAAGITGGFFFLMDVGASLAVGLLFAFLFGLSQLSLEHGWEARPYILLQGTVMAYLWAWHRYATGRPRTLRWVLLFGALGIAFHPFFVAYAGLFFLCSFIFSATERSALFERMGKPRELLPALFGGIALCGLFLYIGKISWFATQGHKFGLDPYEYVGHDKLLISFMVGTFFYPFTIVVAPFLALLALALLRWRRDKLVEPLVAPFLSLTFTVVVTQAGITYSVVKSEYWILQRQWVAGNALSFVIAALLLEFLLRKARLWPSLESRLAEMILVAGLFFVGVGIWSNLSTPFPPSVPFDKTAAFVAKISAEKEISMSQYQDLAHQNALVGGPVWPVLQRLYGGKGEK